MPTTGHPSQRPKSICSSAYFNIKFWYFLRLNNYCHGCTVYNTLLTTNGQLNDTHGYHIKPSNSTCNMISCFNLKGLCVAKKIFFQRSRILIIVEVLTKKNIFLNYAKIRVCFSIEKIQFELAFFSVKKFYPVFIEFVR